MELCYNLRNFEILEIFYTDHKFVWPRWILDLGKQFNLMMHLENVFKTSWTCLGGTFGRLLEDVLKTIWRRMAETNILILMKTSGRSLEDVFWRRRLKTSSRRLHEDEYLLVCYCFIVMFFYRVPVVFLI